MEKKRTFKAGKKNQHDSLFSIRTFEIEYNENITIDEKKAYTEFANSTGKSLEIIDLLNWLDEIVLSKIEELKLPEGTVINRKNAADFHHLIHCAMNAKYRVKLAKDFAASDQDKSAFNALLWAIPSLLTVEFLQYEDLILAGRSRTENGNETKKLKKEELIQLVEPIYQSYKNKGLSSKNAAEKTAKWLLDEKGVNRSARCITGWFHEK
jgi:hypothetical protein